MFEKQDFKKRFDKYYPLLCKIAYGYIPYIDECEDIVQECFIAIWNNEKYKLNDNEFIAYMVRAVKNNCISYLRKKSNSNVSLDSISSNYDVIDYSINTNPSLDSNIFEYDIPEVESEDLTNYDSKLRSLNKALQNLPPRCKEVFLLSKLHGFKYKEIALKLDISIKTVENQMGKAFKLIRENISSENISFIFLFILWITKQ